MVYNFLPGKKVKVAPSPDDTEVDTAEEKAEEEAKKILEVIKNVYPTNPDRKNPIGLDEGKIISILRKLYLYDDVDTSFSPAAPQGLVEENAKTLWKNAFLNQMKEYTNKVNWPLFIKDGFGIKHRREKNTFMGIGAIKYRTSHLSDGSIDAYRDGAIRDDLWYPYVMSSSVIVYRAVEIARHFEFVAQCCVPNRVKALAKEVEALEEDEGDNDVSKNCSIFAKCMKANVSRLQKWMDASRLGYFETDHAPGTVSTDVDSRNFEFTSTPIDGNKSDHISKNLSELAQYVCDIVDDLTWQNSKFIVTVMSQGVRDDNNSAEAPAADARAGASAGTSRGGNNESSQSNGDGGGNDGDSIVTAKTGSVSDIESDDASMVTAVSTPGAEMKEDGESSTRGITRQLSEQLPVLQAADVPNAARRQSIGFEERLPSAEPAEKKRRKKDKSGKKSRDGKSKSSSKRSAA